MIKLNGFEIKPTIFPDKTSQVWKIPPQILDSGVGTQQKIEWIFESEAELMHLAQLRNLLSKPSLYLLYLPYARQDKDISNDSTFALRVFAEIINSLNFSEVSCFDPHSPVVYDCISNFRVISPNRAIQTAWRETRTNLACYPDGGAVQKYWDLGLPYIAGEKVRNQSTGMIESYRLSTEESLKNEKILIVDDICDGGVKKSAKGLLCVEKNGSGNLVLKECVSEAEEQGGELQTVFINGQLRNETTLSEIRKRIDSHLV